jgi:transposase
MVRGLLYEAAKVLLSRSEKPSDLQAWGRSLTSIVKKKATMTVARKLAVILHPMWTTGEPFRWTAAPALAIAMA